MPDHPNRAQCSFRRGYYFEYCHYCLRRDQCLSHVVNDEQQGVYQQVELMKVYERVDRLGQEQSLKAEESNESYEKEIRYLTC